ncbi:MAG: M67 family metallopeptidase [Alphaproteobacteria bacterium]|nr:M67 family metallopeptidase [Alphaproteobacteria bacterium]
MAPPTDTEQLVLAPGLADSIRAQAAASAPRECCGLLEGWRDGDVWHVQALHPAGNLAADADRFSIDPAAHFAAIRAARLAGRAIIGCYHSHPGGQARPSAADLQGAGAEDFVWLIAADRELAAFLYRGGAFLILATGADWVTSSE